GPKWVPVRPCFFLGEITGARNAENTWLRHRIYVTDIEGRQQINLDSYTDRPPFDYAKIKPSHTISLLFSSLSELDASQFCLHSLVSAFIFPSVS
ncbi:unnamed protein product, partial [Rotaria magnacalcarata]